MSTVVARCFHLMGQLSQLGQMLRRWRQKAGGVDVPWDVPAGHVAVSVGRSGRRFIVRATHLNHPVFKRLLGRAEEEHGFANRGGPLAIPCDELLFQDILRSLTRSEAAATWASMIGGTGKECLLSPLNYT